MQKKNLLAGAIVALCIIGILALPASAEQSTTTTLGTGAKLNNMDQGLKDDLWANHMQYRLARYDMNVEKAGAVIGILQKYSIDPSDCSATLDNIKAGRTDLQSALQSRDREKLKAVNEQLKTLWKQFLNEVRDTIRSHYGKGAAGSVAASTADTMEIGGV